MGSEMCIRDREDLKEIRIHPYGISESNHGASVVNIMMMKEIFFPMKEHLPLNELFLGEERVGVQAQ